MRSRTFLFILAILAADGRLQAHDDIRPKVSDGRLVTDGYDDETGDVTLGEHVFGYDFGEDPESPYFAADPGFNSVVPLGLTSGSKLSFSIVSGAGYALPANLTVWDGTDADPSTPGVQIEFVQTPNETISLQLDTTAVVGSTLGDKPGLELTLSAGGSVHRHVAATLGGTAAPDPGVYLFALKLETTDPAVGDSEPFFIVYNFGMDEAFHDAAIDYVQEQFVFQRGDMNGDGDVDNFDIQPFELALTSPIAFGQLYPGVENFRLRGDINRDGVLDNFDIQPLEQLLTTSGGNSSISAFAMATAVPEPATSSLALAAGSLLAVYGAARRRRGRPAA